MKFFLLFAIVIFSSLNLFPQEVLFLKNGDKISGEIQGFDAEKNAILIKNSAMGELQVPWPEVAGIQSSKALYFRLESNNVLSGVANGVEGDKQVIVSPTLGKTLVQREQILIVGLNEEGVSPEMLEMKKKYEQAKEDLRKATELSEIWSGYLEGHFSGNEGNKNDRSFSGVGHLERKTEFDMFVAHIDLRFTESRRKKTASQVEGFLKEDIDVASWLYLWGQLSGKWDEINGIDLRFRAELGLGLHILKPGTVELFEKDKIALRWELGAQFTNTDYDDSPDTHTGGIVTRIIYKHEFIPFEEERKKEDTKPWVFELKGEYYQSFIEPQNRPHSDFNDDYTLKCVASLAIPVTSIVFFTARVWDEYNNVIDDKTKRHNDFYWDLGIRIAL